MKVMNIILKYLAICALWVLLLLLGFGIALAPLVYYQILSAALAVIVMYLAFKAFLKKAGISDVKDR